jgi:3-dehydroshikimate dehydratase
MIRVGLASASLLSLTTKEVVSLASRALVEGIEWSADGHVPCGNYQNAEDVMFTTLRAGLTVVSYATLVRIMPDDVPCVSFSKVLDTARALEAPFIRVWGGDGPSQGLDPLKRNDFITRARAAADKAGSYGITILFSLGKNTYFDSYNSALLLCKDINHPFIKLAWEPLYGDCFENAMPRFLELSSLTRVLYARNLYSYGTVGLLADIDEDLLYYLAYFRNRTGMMSPGIHVMDRYVVVNGFMGGNLKNLIVDVGLLRDRAAKLEIMYRRYTTADYVDPLEKLKKDNEKCIIPG